MNPFLYTFYRLFMCVIAATLSLQCTTSTPKTSDNQEGVPGTISSQIRTDFSAIQEYAYRADYEGQNIQLPMALSLLLKQQTSDEPIHVEGKSSKGRSFIEIGSSDADVSLTRIGTQEWLEADGILRGTSGLDALPIVDLMVELWDKGSLRLMQDNDQCSDFALIDGLLKRICHLDGTAISRLSTDRDILSGIKNQSYDPSSRIEIHLVASGYPSAIKAHLEGLDQDGLPFEYSLNLEVIAPGTPPIILPPN